MPQAPASTITSECAPVTSDYEGFAKTADCLGIVAHLDTRPFSRICQTVMIHESLAGINGTCRINIEDPYGKAHCQDPRELAVFAQKIVDDCSEDGWTKGKARGYGLTLEVVYTRNDVGYVYP